MPPLPGVASTTKSLRRLCPNLPALLGFASADRVFYSTGGGSLEHCRWLSAAPLLPLWTLADRQAWCRSISSRAEGLTSPAPGQLVAGKDVAVAGAGLGGLAFGLSLLKLCQEQSVQPLPRITVFERDASAEARAGQGYFLSVRGDSGGLQVLHRLGVLNDAMQFEELGRAVMLATRSFSKLLSIDKPAPEDVANGRLRISRSNLRQALLRSFIRQGQGQIVWDKQCSGVRTEAGGRVALTFQVGCSEDLAEGKLGMQSDGSEHRCDLLIVADGANSKVRSNLLPLEQPQYEGVTTVAGRTGQMNPMPKEVQEGQWLVFLPTGSTVVMGSLDRTTVFWSLNWRAPQSLAGELNAKLKNAATAEDVFKLVQQKAEGLSGPWPAIWANTDKGALRANNPPAKLPHPNKAPVVFIGDSSHPMTPFSGNGANMAFMDAWQLAQQLTNPQHLSLADCVSAYDAESAPRSTAALREGSFNIRMWHRTGLGHYGLIAVIYVISRVVRLVQMPDVQKTVEKFAAWRFWSKPSAQPKKN